MILESFHGLRAFGSAFYGEKSNFSVSAVLSIGSHMKRSSFFFFSPSLYPLHPKKLSKQQSFRLFSKSMRYRWQFVDGLQTQIKNLAEAAFGCFYHSLFPQHFLNECEFMLPLLFHPFFPLLILLTIECKLRSLHCYTILRILHNLANSFLRLLLCK